jgi:hypothetical protein
VTTGTDFFGERPVFGNDDDAALLLLLHDHHHHDHSL